MIYQKYHSIRKYRISLEKVVKSEYSRIQICILINNIKGRNEKGKMNNKSKDKHFNALEKTLSDKMKTLAKAIEPKVYEHGFLLK